MKLNSDQLQAFFQVAKSESFSSAARELALSQPALSIRIKNLEETLRTSLFVRQSSGLKLTEVGERLFLYCKTSTELESDLLFGLGMKSAASSKVSGLIRVAGFSTVVKSVLIPTLHEIVLSYPDLQIQVLTRELRELNSILKRSEADFVITEGPLVAGNVESVLLGHEENVLVEAKSIRPGKESIYLDNDSEDQATFNYFKAQTKKTPATFGRAFLDEVYTIVEAVELGWGRAVLPQHMVLSNPKLRIVKGFQMVKAPVYLNYFKQPFYGNAHQIVRNQIKKEFGDRLASKKMAATKLS